jgi:hypothetical protein
VFVYTCYSAREAAPGVCCWPTSALQLKNGSTTDIATRQLRANTRNRVTTTARAIGVGVVVDRFARLPTLLVRVFRVGRRLHRPHFNIVLRKLISQYQRCSQRIRKASMSRSYSPVDLKHKILFGQVVSC